ncbi:Hypothetical protein POVR2_LOCUS1, partial [uncultured virus]
VYIINADIKPSNILVNAKCTDACIADFGISSSSGSAKVKLTSRVFSLPEEEVRNHRSHDLFSFVILTLNMLYGRSLSKGLVENLSELQRVVTSLVPTGVMRTTLINLIQEDRTKSWTAERALYELYGERLPKIERKFNYEQTKNPIFLEAISKNIDTLSVQYRFRKASRCYRCSIFIVAILELSSVKSCLAYSTVMCFIFSCVFGTRVSMKQSDKLQAKTVMQLSDLTIERLYTCMNTIIASEDVVRLMFAP